MIFHCFGTSQTQRWQPNTPKKHHRKRLRETRAAREGLRAPRTASRSCPESPENSQERALRAPRKALIRPHALVNVLKSLQESPKRYNVHPETPNLGSSSASKLVKMLPRWAQEVLKGALRPPKASPQENQELKTRTFE